MKRKVPVHLDYDEYATERPRCVENDSRTLSPHSRRATLPGFPAPNGNTHPAERLNDRPLKRPNGTVEDKERSMRLFGGVINTLSQPNLNPHEKRRRAIWGRQKEDTDLLVKRTDQQVLMKEVAENNDSETADQIVYKEKMMRTKHAKLQWEAKQLETKTKPPVYYLPRKLLPHQQETIDKQKSEARAIVTRDYETFRTQRRETPRKRWPNHRRLSPPPQDEMPVPAIDAKNAKEAKRNEAPPKPEATDHTNLEAETEPAL